MLNNIHRLHKLCERAIFHKDCELTYERTLTAIKRLADKVSEFDGDSELIWCVEGTGYVDIASLLIGAYWHSVHWQSIDQTELLEMQTAIGSVYDPNMASGPEGGAEHMVYTQLEVSRNDT